MIVMSQDKKVIIDINGFCVERNLGGKDKKFAIITIPTDNLATSRILGYYSEEKYAMEELQKLFEAMEKGDKTYTISAQR